MEWYSAYGCNSLVVNSHLRLEINWNSQIKIGDVKGGYDVSINGRKICSVSSKMDMDQVKKIAVNKAIEILQNSINSLKEMNN
jgi:hypothetical protein